MVEYHHRSKGNTAEPYRKKKEPSGITAPGRLFLCSDLYATVAQWMESSASQCRKVARFNSGPWYNAGSETPAHTDAPFVKYFGHPEKG